jgi:hypothetical protein
MDGSRNKLLNYLQQAVQKPVIISSLNDTSLMSRFMPVSTLLDNGPWQDKY